MSNMQDQLWVVVRLSDKDHIVDVYEYDTMEEARESFDEEVQVEGHRAALLPKWLYNFYAQETQPAEWVDDDEDARPMIRTWLTDDDDHIVAEVSAVPAGDYEPKLEYGPCCACQQKEAVGVAQLPFTAPVEGTGWGCFQCHQPMNGALAVLCEDCGTLIEAGVSPLSAIKQVCNGMVGDRQRINVADYTHVEFGHNLSLHPEVGSVN